jgi:hypothetical protein
LTRGGHRRAAVALAAAFAVLLAALALPRHARADDSLAPSPMPDPVAAALAEVDAALAAVETSLTSDQPAAAAAVSTLIPDAITQAPAPDAATAAPAEAAPTASPAPTPAAAHSEATTPVAEPAPPPPEPAPAAVTSAPAASETPAPQQAPEQYHGDNATDTISTEKAEREAVPIPSSTARVAPSIWTWNWDWNCDGSATGDALDPVAATTGTWVWNWRWSCGDAAQGASAACELCNTSLSIRVFSPGDDGDVVQAAVSSAVSLAASAAAITQSLVETAAAALPPPRAPPVSPSLPIFGLPLETRAPPPDFALPALPLPLASLAEVSPALDAAIAPLAQALDRWTAGVTAVAANALEEVSPRPHARQPAPTRGRAAAAGRVTRDHAAPQSWRPAEPHLAAWSEQTATDTRHASTTPRTVERSLPERSPKRQAPFWPPAPQPSATGGASGSGASAGGLAVLLGVLWAVAPVATRWLRVARGPRPRPPYASRPERPG